MGNRTILTQTMGKTVRTVAGTRKGTYTATYGPRPDHGHHNKRAQTRSNLSGGVAEAAVLCPRYKSSSHQQNPHDPEQMTWHYKGHVGGCCTPPVESIRDKQVERRGHLGRFKGHR